MCAARTSSKARYMAPGSPLSLSENNVKHCSDPASNIIVYPSLYINVELRASTGSNLSRRALCLHVFKNHIYMVRLKANTLSLNLIWILFCVDVRCVLSFPTWMDVNCTVI